MPRSTRFLEALMTAIRVLVAMCFLATAAGPASAQNAFPERTVRILVGYVPGGPNDIIARAIGDKLAQVWDRSVVVENVPGAGGNIAGDRVAKAARRRLHPAACELRRRSSSIPACSKR